MKATASLGLCVILAFFSLRYIRIFPFSQAVIQVLKSLYLVSCLTDDCHLAFLQGGNFENVTDSSFSCYI